MLGLRFLIFKKGSERLVKKPFSHHMISEGKLLFLHV